MIISTEQDSQSPSIDLAPLIDMVFLLLIFFLVATTFQQSEREMQILLPEAESAAPITMSLREIVINVAADGSIVVGGATRTTEELRELVAQAVESNPDQKVSVRADRGVAYGLVASVLDACKSAGVNDPFLDTVPID